MLFKLIWAVFVELIGFDWVAIFLVHKGLSEEHPLVSKRIGGFICGQQASIMEDLCKEAAIEEMSDGVLTSTEVEVNRHPVVGGRTVPGTIGAVWARKA